jgi:carbon storage regulator
VLSRKESEKIQIGGDIVLTVVEIRGNKVRLGIQAPKHVAVDREEVAELKRCEAFLESLREDRIEASLDVDPAADAFHCESVYECTVNPTSVLSSGAPL